MELTLLRASANIDPRGSILTWLPDEPIAEFDLNRSYAGAVRGMHYHPEFVEYLLFVEGRGTLLWIDPATSKHVESVTVATGIATRAPIGLAHAVIATSDLLFVAMLTKRWDDCDVPIVMRADLFPS